MIYSRYEQTGGRGVIYSRDERTGGGGVIYSRYEQTGGGLLTLMSGDTARGAFRAADMAATV